jgi:hypothetical protein
LATLRSVGALRRGAESTAATCSTSASFITSAGWNWSGPAPIQRRAPFTVTPKPGSSTSTSSTNAPTSSIGVKRRTGARP